ncbi:MAG: hypothetical protein LBL00_03855, partial [Endomicrobium sp.]|nr:hypothetical protein [Endomicrobium sp.]
NLYLIVDPANEKKKENDYTTICVIGLGEDGNYYLIYGLRDKLGLKERTDMLFEVRRKFPRLKDVGYEAYGMLSDIEHIELEMERENFRFPIKKLHGNVPKNDRIKRLVPPLETGKFFVPKEMFFVDSEGKQQDFIKLLKDELRTFPYCAHDDILDNIARIMHKQQSKNPKEIWKPVFPIAKVLQRNMPSQASAAVYGY